jgi:hypothetical protein
VQKERAKIFWNDSIYDDDGPMKSDIHDKVMESLNRGLLPPIFHSLCRHPNERLFSLDAAANMNEPELNPIKLCSDEVEAGTCESLLALQQLESANEKSHRSFKDRSFYLPLFFTTTGAARHDVTDGECKWKFHSKYTNIVTALVNTPTITPATMVGEDVEVTKMQGTFPIDETNGNSLITRRLSRGVVADCFAKSKRHGIYAIVGNVGIGKSWTLIYALQQALLYENACVVLCFHKDGSAVVCI